MGERWAVVALFVVVVLATQPTVAQAGGAWCAEDPILEFSNGTTLQLVVLYGADQLPSVTDPILWSVQVPSNVGSVVVTVPLTASHHESVTLDYTGGKWGGGTNDIQIHATALVQAVTKFPLQLSVYGDTSTSPMNGSSNKALTIAAHTHTGDFTAYQGVTAGATYTFTGSGSIALP
jgi:hypothetical protein